MSYPSDLSERPWQKLARLFERPGPRGARSKYPKRRVVAAVLYLLARVAARLPALGHRVRPLATLAGARRVAAGRRRAGHPRA